MKKLLVLAAALGLASAGFARAVKIEILKDEGFKTTDYSSIELSRVSAKDFLASIREKKNYDDIAEEAEDMNLLVKTYVGQYCSDGFNGGKAGRALKMTMDMADYNPGSRAAAAFVGFGAGSGHVKYEIHLWDGKNDVASFACQAGMQRLTDVSGEAGKAKAPKILVSEIRQFFDTH
jgi:hypothetical protein